MDEFIIGSISTVVIIGIFLYFKPITYGFLFGWILGLLLFESVLLIIKKMRDRKYIKSLGG